MQIKKIHVGIDLDGVLIDYKDLKKKAAKSFGYILKNNQTAAEVMNKFLSPDVCARVKKRVYGKDGLSNPPISGAIKALRHITKMGILITIISRRQKDNQKYAYEWINKYLKNFVNPENIYFVSDIESKSAIIKKRNIDIFIDDQLKVLKAISIKTIRVFFDQFNQFSDITIKKMGIIRIDSWQNFVKLLNKWTKK